MILVSSCLAGLKVRYNGTHSLNEKIEKLVKDGKATMVCPEILGGLSTPREPAEISGGNGDDVLDGKACVIEKSGKDVTSIYIEGAYRTLKKVQLLKATLVVLKENSPSCGSSMIYDGQFNGNKIYGNGVTSALLKRHNIKETFARNSPFARGIPPNRKKTKNGNEISKTMAKSWIKSPNGC